MPSCLLNLVVLDLEWNSPYHQKESLLSNGVELKHEIIEIGSVRYTDWSQVFDRRIRPQYFQKMNPYTTQVTGLREENLRQGVSFLDGWREFLTWAGPDPVLVTWSESDAAALLTQLKFLGAEQELPRQFLDLQAVFSCFVLHKRKQWALSAALEHLGLETEQQLHRALADAQCTAKILERIFLILREHVSNAEEALESFFFDPRAPYRKTFCVPLGRGQKMKECLQEMRFFCPKCQRELLVSADSIDSNDVGAGSRTQRSERAKKWKGKGQFVLRQFGRMVATRQCPQHGPVQIQAWQGRSAQGKPQPWIHCQIRGRAPGEIWWERMSQLEEPNKAAQGTAAEREAE